MFLHLHFRNWCQYTVSRTVSCQVQNGTETSVQRVFQGCRWPGPCSKVIRYLQPIHHPYHVFVICCFDSLFMFLHGVGQCDLIPVKLRYRVSIVTYFHPFSTWESLTWQNWNVQGKVPAINPIGNLSACPTCSCPSESNNYSVSSSTGLFLTPLVSYTDDQDTL